MSETDKNVTNLIAEARKVSVAIYAVADEPVADDLSRILRQLADALESVTDERNDPRNWPDGAPWLTSVTVPTESERERLALVMIDHRYPDIAWSLIGNPGKEKWLARADVVLAAGFRLPVPRDITSTSGKGIGTIV